MDPMRAVVPLLVVLVAVPVAGCLGDAPPVNDSSVPADPDPVPAGPGPVDASGASAVEFVEDFAMSHPNRYDNSQLHEASRTYLEDELRSMGLDVTRQAADGYVNILGIQNGSTHPDEWVVVSAHYDTTPTTIYGAWDDGAGVAAVLEMARTFSEVEFNRTIVYTFFDGEEEGLQGSQRFVQHYMQDSDVHLVANLNLDPPGLNYPCENPDGSPIPVLVFRQQGPGIPLHDGLFNDTIAAIDAVGVPEDARSIRSGIPVAMVGGAGLSGTSDHASFHGAGVANLFLGGAPITEESNTQSGALTYLLHTPLDTIQHMVARCGGADLLEGGFQTILDVAYDTLVRFDTRPTPSMDG